MVHDSSANNNNKPSAVDKATITIPLFDPSLLSVTAATAASKQNTSTVEHGLRKSSQYKSPYDALGSPRSMLCHTNAKSKDENGDDDSFDSDGYGDGRTGPAVAAAGVNPKLVKAPKTSCYQPQLSKRNSLSSNVRYTVAQVPPWSLLILLASQHVVGLLGALVMVPLIIVPLMGGTNQQAAQLIGTTYFVTGLNTLVQTAIGSRLPILEVPSFSYLAPTLSIIQNAQLQAIENPQERFEQTMQVLSGSILVRRQCAHLCVCNVSCFVSSIQFWTASRSEWDLTPKALIMYEMSCYDVPCGWSIYIFSLYSFFRSQKQHFFFFRLRVSFKLPWVVPES